MFKFFTVQSTVSRKWLSSSSTNHQRSPPKTECSRIIQRESPHVTGYWKRRFDLFSILAFGRFRVPKTHLFNNALQSVACGRVRRLSRVEIFENVGLNLCRPLVYEWTGTKTEVFEYSRTSMSTTSHKRPPIQNTKIFPVKSLQLEPLVNDHLL